MVNYLSSKGFDITGTETNQEYINYSRQHFGIKLHNTSGQDLKFNDGKFDAVLSFDVFEHIPDTNRRLNEINRVLKKWLLFIWNTE